MKKGLLLGAGFSVDFAMPLVWELTEEMRRLIPSQKFLNFNNSWKLQKNGFSDEAVNLFIELYDDKTIHYEQIVGGLEVFSERYENRGIRDDLLGIKKWLMEMIYYLLYPRQIGNVQFNYTTINMYRGIKSLLNEGYPLWIFTLNHDLMVECFAGENGIPLRNGFFDEKIVVMNENGSDGNTVSFKSLDINDMEKTGFNFFNKVGDYGINLLKIHGSLDIFGYNDLKSYLSLHVEKPGLDSISKALKAINEIIIPDKFPRVSNEILLKDKTGEIQFLRRSLLSGVFKFKDNSSQIIPSHFLKQFTASVNFCEELIVVGYSFGDIHINEVVKKWLEFTGKRLLRIISPVAPNIDFLGHVKAQIVYENKTSLEYFSELPGGKLTRQEKLLHSTRTKIRTNPENAKKIKDGLKHLLEILKTVSGKLEE